MMTAFSFGLTASMRAIAASTSAEGLSSPRRTSSAWAVASRKASSSDMRPPYDRPTPGHKKWYSRAMPILDARHDFGHPVESDTAWSESYYFNAYDPATDAGFFTRIGIRPNEGTMDVGLSLWLPGMELAAVRGVRPQHEMTDGDLAVAGVRYERLVPMERWRLTCDAEAIVLDLRAERAPRPARLVMDAEFRALTPAIGSDGQGRSGTGASAETRQLVGKGHLEQPGRWSGWIEAGGVRYELARARGNRDKSWGPRRWGGPRMWRWFSINVGD